jgi:hypothetical protein
VGTGVQGVDAAAIASPDDAVPEIRYASRVVYTSSPVCGRGETVDARDLKSLGRKAMPVQVRPSAPTKLKIAIGRG